MGEFVACRKPHIVCTPNVDHITQAQRDEEFRSIINSADLAIPDGMGVVYASRLLGTPLLENVGGRPLLVAFCGLAALKGYSVFFLGSMPGVAEKAADILKQRFKGLVIAGTYSPPIDFENIDSENAKALNRVVRAHPDALFVALGAPRQEKWMHRHLASLDVPVSMAVGSTFDVISGEVRKAPNWMTDVGLEWLYRIHQDPRRLGKRYLVSIPFFVWQVLKQRIVLKQKREQL